MNEAQMKRLFEGLCGVLEFELFTSMLGLFKK